MSALRGNKLGRLLDLGGSVNPELRALSESYWQDELKASPIQALMLGIHDYDEEMDDASREAEDARIALLRAYAAKAAAFDPDTLTADEKVTRDVMIFEAGTRADLLEMREAELAVNHAIGLQAMLPVLFPQLPIDEPEHAEAMLVKYPKFGTLFDQMTDRLRSGVANGRTPMASTVEKVVAQLDGLLETPPETSAFLTTRSPQAYSLEQTEA